LVLLTSGIGLEGCRCGGSSGDYQDPEKAKLAFRGNSVRAVPETDDPYCPNPVKVEQVAKTDLFYPLSEVYKAALMDDAVAGLAQFHAQFAVQNPGKLEHRKRQLWPRIRQHVGKYVLNPEKFSFEVCKQEKKNDGSVRVTVRSHDLKKSHPPSVLKKVDGNWKIYVFTY